MLSKSGKALNFDQTTVEEGQSVGPQNRAENMQNECGEHENMQETCGAHANGNRDMHAHREFLACSQHTFGVGTAFAEHLCHFLFKSP